MQSHSSKTTKVLKFGFRAMTFVCLVLISKIGLSQEAEAPEVYKTRMKMEFVKKGDNTKVLKAKISAKIDRKNIPVENVNIHFFDQTDSTQLLGQSSTNEKGLAEFVLPAEYAIGRDTSSSSFKAKFEGNELYKPSKTSMEVKEAGLTARYEVVDSVYTVYVNAFEMVNGQAGEPLTDLDVYAYVQRMFSLLKVGEGWLQDGEAEIIIPHDLPGDEANNLKLIIKIPETELYGSVETENMVTWGEADTWHERMSKIKKRALWEPMAPLWMVITLSILIAGVFYHYFLIMYKLFKINYLNNHSSENSKD